MQQDIYIKVRLFLCCVENCFIFKVIENGVRELVTIYNAVEGSRTNIFCVFNHFVCYNHDRLYIMRGCGKVLYKMFYVILSKFGNDEMPASW